MQFLKKSKVEVTGVNFGELVALIQKAQIAVDMRRAGDTVMIFEISGTNLPLLFEILDKKCYTYRVITSTRPSLWYGAGLMLGAVVVVVFWLIMAQFCWGTKISAADPDVEAAVAEFLATRASPGCAWSDMDFDALETQIMSAVPSVSMVSVSRRGAYLIVNTSIATPSTGSIDDADNLTGIFADRAGVVSRIFVASGTALVRVGDSVSVGQMLVAPYSIDAEGVEQPVAVNADVYLYVWESSCVEFCTETQEYARTGNFVTSEQTTFGGAVLSTRATPVNFAHFETVTTRRWLSSILPIAIETTYYYETVAVSVSRDFDAEKASLIYEAKQKLLQRVPENEILEQTHNINQVDGRYYVSFYAKCEYKVG